MNNIKTNYQITLYACYIAYITQGVVNLINPIMFAVYQRRLGLSLGMISALIVFNFGMQIVVDYASSLFVDKIGYRASMIIAHVSAVAGLLVIGVVPTIMYSAGMSAVPGLVLGTLLNAVGGGLQEVLVSPIVEAAPGEEKEKAMSLLHSFYCWGCVGFTAITTLLLRVIGEPHWYYIPIIWAVIPALNILLFFFVPIGSTIEEGEEGMKAGELVKSGTFWVLVVIMLCSGASELAMSQWASYFAEIGLGVNKTLGDLLGACFFAVLMGCARLFYGKKGELIDLKRFMKGSCILCVISYLLAVFAPYPILGLMGCGLCGLSVGILWPGTFSIAAKAMKNGGTAMFAFLALAGDVGCATGPEVVSIVSGIFPEYGLKAGLLAAIIFPIILLIMISGIDTSGLHRYDA